MTAFFLKIIAVFCMLLDHIGALLYTNIPFLQAELNIPYESMRETIDFLRGFGRLSFPVFAFLLVVGYQHTKSKKKYFTNLLMFAIISQMPYSLLFSNYDNIKERTKFSFFFDPNDFYIKSILEGILFVVVCIFCYCKFVKPEPKDRTLKILVAALLLVP